MTTKGTWGLLNYYGRRALFTTQLGGGKKHIWIKISETHYITACGRVHDLTNESKLGLCDMIEIESSPSPQDIRPDQIQYYTNGKIRKPFCEECQKMENTGNDKC